MFLISFLLACLSQAEELSVIQVGNRLRKRWHEAPLLYDLLIMDASVL